VTIKVSCYITELQNYIQDRVSRRLTKFLAEKGKEKY